MSLQNTLSDIVSRLREGRIPNEQAISQGVVLRILQDLGWNTWDTNVVWPEYRTGEGRADFALCHPASRPAVFIEVKPVGRAEDAVRQALDYAFHTGGVPFVILTDGQTWSFYLTMEQGTYEERRVYKLDLFERSNAEAAEKFSEYLGHDRVVSGQALAAARDAYRNRNRAAQAKTAIPAAWQELIGSGNETLVDLLASAVESKAGVRPDDDDVLTFLAALGKPIIFQSPTSPPTTTQQFAPREPQARTTAVYDAAASSRRGTLILDGKAYPYNNAKEAMVITLRELARRDSTFLQRCSQRADAQGRKRNYIARTPEQLYPDRPDLREYREELPGGWYVATNLNNVLKKSIIRLAAEVAGLTFGRDVTVEF
jgi:predicted type IV restriction endonuclease